MKLKETLERAGHAAVRFLSFLYGVFAALFTLMVLYEVLSKSAGLLKSMFAGADGGGVFWGIAGTVLMGLLVLGMLVAFPAVLPLCMFQIYSWLLSHMARSQAIAAAWAIFILGELSWFCFYIHPEPYSTLLDSVNRKRAAAQNRQPPAPVNRPANRDVAVRQAAPPPPTPQQYVEQQPRQLLMPEPLGLTVEVKKHHLPDLTAFDALVGVDEAIEAIKDALELPIRYPEKMKEYRITPPRGILLYGPPGTGKTSLARAASKYFACTFISVRGSEIAASLVGQTEQNVRGLFATARRERPTVIFFDEIDAIGRKRDGMALNRPSDLALNTLLAEMDGFETNNQGVFVLGATNRPDVLDDALLRPGRFDRLIEIRLPGLEARRDLWRLYLAGRPVRGAVDFDFLARASEGMSPADIRSVVERAAIEAVKQEVKGGEKGIDAQALHAFLERRFKTIGG